MSYADHFSLANIPYGIASTPRGNHPDKAKAVVTRLGDSVIFLADLELDCSDHIKSVLKQPTLNSLACLPKEETQHLRKCIQAALSGNSTTTVGTHINEVDLHLPFTTTGFTDFSCSKEHLLNAGEAVLGVRSMPPAALHYPIGYSGRPSSIVVSGTDIRRPNGVYPVKDKVELRPSRALDYELEVAAIVGKPSRFGEPVKLEEADEHIFGLVLLNDWSARDIQGFEMTPLGPMNGKSFGTSISPWVVTLDALEPFATPSPSKDFPVTAFLQDKKSKPSYDIKVEAEILSSNDGAAATKVCTANVKWMYWTFRDLVTQATINGCNLNTGDVLATGTVSGAGDHEHGCLLEMTKGGKVGFELNDGAKRTYLEDGDGVRLTAYCGGGVGFGACTGFITSAAHIN